MALESRLGQGNTKTNYFRDMFKIVVTGEWMCYKVIFIIDLGRDGQNLRCYYYITQKPKIAY